MRLVRCPLCKTIEVRSPNGSRRPLPIQFSYSGLDLQKLRELADAIRERKNDDNQLLHRAALLHADIVMLMEPADAGTAPKGTPFESIVVKGRDGRQVSVSDGTMHWATGRAVLDLVAPDGRIPAPAEDAVVRRWYRASMAYLQYVAIYDPPHFDRAAALFPSDPDIQFLYGCLHEALASSRVQNMMQTVSTPTGMVFEIKPVRTELRVAEERFRRALSLRPDFIEARLRLGRVLGQLGRHEDAVTELRLLRGMQPGAADDESIPYYMWLFLGAEEEATGHTDAARAAYERAAALYPYAQAPRLALSQLARRSGDRIGALRAIGPLLALPADDGDRPDPWWLYHSIEGRAASDLFDELYRPFRRTERP